MTQNCCDSVEPTQTVVISILGEKYTVPADGRCFSWRVRSICSDGNLSDWTESMCSCDTSAVGGKLTKKSMSTPGHTGKINAKQDLLEIKAIPNPAKDHVKITVEDHSGVVTLIQSQLVILDVTNRIVYKSENLARRNQNNRH